MKKTAIYLFSTIVLILFIGFASYQPAANSSAASSSLTSPSPSEIPVTNQDKDLPLVGSTEKLRELLQQAVKNGMYGTGNREMAMVGSTMRNAMKSAAVDQAQEAGSVKSKSADYSSTNVQVQGVDEADVVKTDGKYIYQVNNNRVVIAQVQPTEQMQIVQNLTFEDKNFHPQELYVDEKFLIVIGSTYYDDKSTVKALIFDITNLPALKKIREVELEGYYVSSRKIGPSLYLVANKAIDYYLMEQTDIAPPLPTYRDTALKDDFVAIGCDTIRYFPGSPEPNYLVIGGLNLAQPEKELQVSTFLGSGQNVYASLDNLFVAVARFETGQQKAEKGANEITANKRIGILPMPVQTNTALYKFSLEEGTVTYQAKGEVPGTILNQFSMDEYEGHFRIATTKGYMGGTGTNAPSNNVYILGNSLEIVGSLESIAPGERIYSTRFMGNRLYMVTFKQVDPLFVIDLKDPNKPTILGELKIPGYSNYLHPYDENHIIGFGKDTVETSGKDSGDEKSMAYYLGLKIALFDVSDVANPIEKHQLLIGDRGTESEVLHNHKALLFNKEKNLLAFPVTLMEVKGASTGEVHQYGEFVFQGLFVYDLEPREGFRLRGRISHLTTEETKQVGRNWYDTDKNIERALYIDNTLYTLSKGLIKANDLATLTEQNTLKINRAAP